MDFARERLALSRLIAFSSRENGAPVAVMRKLGFRLEGAQSIFGLDADRYALNLADGI